MTWNLLLASSSMMVITSPCAIPRLSGVTVTVHTPLNLIRSVRWLSGAGMMMAPCCPAREPPTTGVLCIPPQTYYLQKGPGETLVIRLEKQGNLVVIVGVQ